MKKIKLIPPISKILTLIWLMVISTPGFATDTQLWVKSDESNSQMIDHQKWQSLLDRYLITNHSSGVNRFRYSEVTKVDKESLKNYLSELQKIDPRKYNRAVQMAYWINLYNSLTVDLIIENYPVKTIKKLGKGLFSFGPWDDQAAVIAGQKLSLNDIEHKILRPIWQDPRIHYAVNCASYGCPNLSGKVFTSENTNVLLDQAARDYVNHARGVQLNKGKLTVSSIYHWYLQDFGGNDVLLIKHLSQYAKPELKQLLRKYQGNIDHDYDWSLNEPSQTR